ncbi:alpha/beta hydrolase-fold protein [Pseudomonas aeruginosa]|nr:alpha/beta hydrolase-fold protein [Pseudomonas aeruginosa]
MSTPAAGAGELPCNEAFADMLAHELLPWLQQRYALSEEPADRVLSGSSYGGLAWAASPTVTRNASARC